MQRNQHLLLDSHILKGASRYRTSASISNGLNDSLTGADLMYCIAEILPGMFFSFSSL
jgi:hypothetical protein